MPACSRRVVRSALLLTMLHVVALLTNGISVDDMFAAGNCSKVRRPFLAAA